MRKIIAVVLILCLPFTLCAAASKADLYGLTFNEDSDSIELEPAFIGLMFELSLQKLKEEDFSVSACATTAAFMYADALMSAKDDADVELDGHIFLAAKKEKDNEGLILIITDEEKTLFITCSGNGNEFFMTETYPKSKSTLKSELKDYTDRYESISPMLFVQALGVLADTIKN